MAVDHYENFPVASILLPRRLRRPVEIIYHFARQADDFADEGEEEYDFYGYDERYYPRPPWVWPRGIEWLHQCRDISQALQARGFSPDEAAGVMGMNFLRVLATIWGS